MANRQALRELQERLAARMQAAREHRALLLHVDSEHNAIFQSLPHNYLSLSPTGSPQLGVSQILLTASGGPFLDYPDDLEDRFRFR
jgi:1-deoxy-D-xylulose-5-phosphate reductoisomerase